MPIPSQTFSTISDLLTYINTFFIPNGNQEIDGDEGNNILNALANFIVKYTLNSSKVKIDSGNGAIILSVPFTVLTGSPVSVQWPDNIQNEYYINNATASIINTASGFFYIDQFGEVKTYFPARTTIHIAKATNGAWVQVNNSVTSESLLNVIGYRNDSEIGTPESLMEPGQTTLVLPFNNYVRDSYSIFLDGTLIIPNRTDRFSYTIDYTNPAEIVIEFNTGVQIPWIITIQGLRSQIVVPPTVSTTFLVVDTYADMVAASIGSSFKKILVRNDENKNDVNIEYNFWPNEVINWDIVVEETDLNP